MRSRYLYQGSATNRTCNHILANAVPLPAVQNAVILLCFKGFFDCDIVKRPENLSAALTCPADEDDDDDEDEPDEDDEDAEVERFLAAANMFVVPWFDPTRSDFDAASSRTLVLVAEACAEAFDLSTLKLPFAISSLYISLHFARSDCTTPLAVGHRSATAFRSFGINDLRRICAVTCNASSRVLSACRSASLSTRLSSVARAVASASGPLGGTARARARTSRSPSFMLVRLACHAWAFLAFDSHFPFGPWRNLASCARRFLVASFSLRRRTALRRPFTVTLRRILKLTIISTFAGAR